MTPAVSIIDVAAAEARLAAGGLCLDARSIRQRGLRLLRGATRLPWTDTRTGGSRSGLLRPPDVLAATFAEAGVDWARPVVVVGAGPAGWGEGARVAWALAYLNHPNVAWLPLFGALPRVRSKASSGAHRGWDGTVQAALRAPGGVEIPAGSVVVDVRSHAEQAGAKRYGEARGGHIPGACFLPLGELWSSEGLAPSEQVRGRARAAGIPLDAPIVCVCTGGVRSAAAALMLDAAGVGATVQNLDGGMWAWSADPARPMATRTSTPMKPR